MIKNSPIGFFDSGVGGLSVFARFKEILPNENTIYFGDLKNMPYGNKTKDELISFARNILDYFKSRGVKAVVIACNTSSAVAYESIKDDYDFKIYPILQKCARMLSNIEKIGVFATAATINSNAYKNEILKYNPSAEVIQIACPNWTSIVESGNMHYSDAKADIKSHVDDMLNHKPNKIILGCTHYPYLLSILAEFAPKELFIDPAVIFADYIKRDLAAKDLLNPSDKAGFEEFFVSAAPANFIKNSKLFYDVKNTPQILNLPID